MTDLWIVGLGIREVDQVTRETERVLRSVNEVLFVDTGIATQPFLETLCPRVSSLYQTSYSELGHRVGAYRAMAVAVIEAALERPPVAFAMQGHPLVGAYAPFLMRDMADVLGLSVEVLPGVSSVACLLADLWLDPMVTGLQMLEATDLLLRRRTLQSDLPALIWQAGTVETRLHSARVSRPERFHRLVAHLLQFYPRTHPVTIAYASPHRLVPEQRETVPLEALPDHAPAIHPGATLFLPATHRRPIQDARLLRDLDDPAHLRAITHSD